MKDFAQHTKSALMLAGLISIAWSAPALALEDGPQDDRTSLEDSALQQDPEAEDPAAEDEFGDNIIVVTAQKRAERIQDVPVSLVVTQGDTLRDLNLNAATDLQYLSPGLGLGDSNTPRGAGFRVRGIGTNVFADGIEQSVGTVVDGVPLARAGQGLADLIDVERIEVLRGPQGMLFGRNSSAGLINIVTRRPTSYFSFEALASYGEDDDVRTSATIAGPFGDSVAARLTGFFNRQDGYIHNLFDGEKLNNRKEYGLRGVVEFDLGATTEIVLRGDWSKRDNRANIWTIRELPSTTGLFPLLDPAVIAGINPQNTTVNINGDVFNKMESWGAMAEINQELGDYTITSLTSYRKWRQSDNNDADQSTFNVLDLNFGSNRLEQFSQELRITSPADQFISFVAGAFYYNATNHNISDQVGRVATSLALAGANGIPLFGGLIQPNDLGGRRVEIGVDVEDFALFGQAEVHFSDTFKAILGGRYTHTRVDAVFDRTVGPGATAAFNSILGASFAPLAYDLTTSDDNFSWRVGLQYQPTRDHNIFATVSRGYKGPGFDTQVGFTVTPGTSALESALVNPEITTNYEIGYKGSLLDNKVDFSVTLYQMNVRNFQAQVYELPPGGGIGSFRVRNAGKMRAKGFEIEINTRPAYGFNFGVSLAYNDTTFREFTGATCPRLGQLVTEADNGTNCGLGASAFDASGLDAPNAPKWTVSANTRYERELFNDVNGFIQANAYLRSDNYYQLYPDNIRNVTEQDGYVVVNGSIGLNFMDDKLSLAIFARNLFGQNFVTNIADLPLSGPGDLAQFTTRDAQRTLGVQLGLRF